LVHQEARDLGRLAGRADGEDDRNEDLGDVRRQYLDPTRYVTPYALALVHAALGQTDEAYARLDNAFDERSTWLVLLRLDPRWKMLRGDRRFTERVARLNFPPLLNRR
jgi:hypothetical protein